MAHWGAHYLTSPVVEDELGALGEQFALALRAVRREALEDAMKVDCGWCAIGWEFERGVHKNPSNTGSPKFAQCKADRIRALIAEPENEGR